MQGVRNDIKLYRKTVDETPVRNLTMNYYLSVSATKLFANSGLAIPSIVTLFSAVQNFGTNNSRSDAKKQ